MRLQTHPDAASFLSQAQAPLETNEAANGLMLGLCLRLVRQPDAYPSPLCFKTVSAGGDLVLAAMMTPPHNLIVYGHQGDMQAATQLLATDLERGDWEIPGVLGPRESASAFVESWRTTTGQVLALERRQRVYELHQVIAEPPQRGRLRVAGEADVDLVTGWTSGFNLDALGQADQERSRHLAERRIAAGDIYLWEDPRPVSMAMKTRPTQHGISISLVYTPTEQRNKGYATACVGELSRQLLSSGRQHCSLFADLDNPAANRVYQRIGYEPSCDYDEYTFREQG